jgi:hypothetical protein
MFLLIPYRKYFDKKKVKVKIDSAASSGDQGEPIYFVNFPSPPLEAALSCSEISLFISAKEFCFLFTGCLRPSISERNYPALRITK